MLRDVGFIVEKYSLIVIRTPMAERVSGRTPKLQPKSSLERGSVEVEMSNTGRVTLEAIMEDA
jgi:hypothetical protein